MCLVSQLLSDRTVLFKQALSSTLFISSIGVTLNLFPGLASHSEKVSDVQLFNLLTIATCINTDQVFKANAGALLVKIRSTTCYLEIF